MKLVVIKIEVDVDIAPGTKATIGILDTPSIEGVVVSAVDLLDPPKIDGDFHITEV